MNASRIACGVLMLAIAATSWAQTPAGTTPKLRGIWEPINYTEDLSLTDVFFVTPEIGYVAGNAGTILKTTDSGNTWEALLGGDPQSEERAITQLWFVTPSVGWAAQVTSSHTNLFRTTDGESWARIGTIPEHYEDFAFGSESEGIYVNDEKIFRTSDGGKNWKQTYDCVIKAQIQGLSRQVKCNIWKLRYASPSLVYALGQAVGAEAAVLLKSADGGESWSVLTVLEDENAAEGGLFFLDENTGYFSTKYAKASYRTVDGGATWSGMPATTMARRIIFADPEVGWALHFNQLSFTTDGGRRWSSRTLAFPAMPNAFSLPRRDIAYVVGDHGMIYRYRIVPEGAPVAAKVIAAPAMPPLDNGVITKIASLETTVESFIAALDKADDAAPGSAGAQPAWSDAGIQQQVAQLQTSVEAVATGVPQLGRKHRNLNLAMFGLKLLGDLTGQGNGLKQAFAGLRQARGLEATSSALTSLHTQIEAMKTSVDTFKTAKTAPAQ